MKKKKPSIGPRLVKSMQQLVDVLASGAPEEKHFTVRTVEISDPPEYDSRAVKRLRARLGVSQSVFAQLLGVSPMLVQHWEQSVALPRALARRLLDEISRDPDAFLERHLSRRTVACA